ncbi:hypothetical protein P1J78_11995 [Psychromarinibacter sp. C21-152]|uniref:Uncharacterized protein n=1 Tax=Psychromarinibacter sediminicola TaxID=3033385 RepID=A0AAE3NVL8_9RHOB|nr:hypothetical protein [Psychromarinibacter sediminicola]MDF0601457.1 hypothetical protein [Psychromarinibacter sediminicola]
MATRQKTELLPASEWKSLSFCETGAGYAVREAIGCEMRSLCMLRFAGFAMLVAGAMSWLLAPMGSLDEMLLRGSGAALLVGLGVAMILLSGRGKRRSVRFDPNTRELHLAKLGAGGQETVSTRLPLDWIESLYVRRVDQGDGFAWLIVRVTGAAEFHALRGPEGEVTALQRKLARDFVAARTREDANVVELPRRKVMPRRVYAQTGRVAAAAHG